METKMDPKRIDIKKLTLAQLALITPIIEEYRKSAYSPETKNYTAEEAWVEFTDPETGLKYDLTLYCDEEFAEFMAVDLYNVVKDPSDPSGKLFTTDISPESRQKAWDSRYVTFEEWVKFKKSDARGDLQLKMIVACIDASGKPELHSCEVTVTKEEYDQGKHYDMAVENAEFNSYEGPMIAFDPVDLGKGKKLQDLSDWFVIDNRDIYRAPQAPRP